MTKLKDKPVDDTILGEDFVKDVVRIALDKYSKMDTTDILGS